MRPGSSTTRTGYAVLGYIDMLRDVGKHFSVNMMIQKESVCDRLENREQGISYTEFSYMILQAYDFPFICDGARNAPSRSRDPDQYGNIVAGIDLIRREFVEQGDDVLRGYGITALLITKADGTKFGKTESGAVWLTADRTSPYAFHQFWLNTSDADVGKYLRWFVPLPRGDRGPRSPSRRVAPAASRPECGGRRDDPADARRG